MIIGQREQYRIGARGDQVADQSGFCMLERQCSCQRGQCVAAIPSGETPSSVRAAGAKAAGKVGELVSSHILARPHEDLMKVFIGEPAKK